ncbi:MAG: circularly permuted type 2 ATP-grasp protein, partial [Burkholderiales bacterium]
MYLPTGEVRPHYASFAQWFASQSGDAMAVKRAEADLLFRRIGITFSLSGDEGGTERLIPSDLIPRIIDASAWELMEQGLVQRVKALNRFLHDVYHDQAILRAGIVPAEQVLA